MGRAVSRLPFPVSRTHRPLTTPDAQARAMASSSSIHAGDTSRDGVIAC